jgi:uncharacterized membrane protein YagU involved in acid resistance
MDTTKNSTRLIKVLIIGAITGMIGGAVMAMFTMIATATYLNMGFFTPLYAIASPLAGQQSLMTSLHQGVFYFAPGAGLLGLVVHMMWSALFGMIFGLIVYATHLKGTPAVISGMIFGVLVMLLMSFVVAPIVGAPNLLQMLGGLSFTLGHLMFGLVLGLWPVLRPQDFASQASRQIRQAA